MATISISLPRLLKDIIDEQMSQRGFATCSEYVPETAQKDQDRLHLRELLLTGAGSDRTEAVTAAYFDGLQRMAMTTKGRSGASSSNLRNGETP